MAEADINPPNLMIICVDSLRADHLSLYGYERTTSPNIDAFFKEGTVYERCYPGEASTSPSVVTILSGLLPQNHRVRLHFQKLPKETKILPDYLRAAGYQNLAVVSNMVLTDEAIGMKHRFDTYDDYVSQAWPDRNVYERNAEETSDAILKWLRESASPNQPHFIYAHYMDPHGPYLPPPNKPIDFTHPQPLPIDMERVLKYISIDGVSDGFEYVDLYDEEIAYTDREIGRLLLEYLKAGYGENSVIVFTADHGESMMEHEKWFEHGYHVYEEIVHIPLAIRGPGFESMRVATPVTSADIAPTLLRSAGVEVSEIMDGIPLSKKPPVRDIFTEATTGGLSRRSVIRENEKWVVVVKRKEGFFSSMFSFFTGEETYVRNQYLFDLGQDPDESLRLAWKDSPSSEALHILISQDPDPAGIPKEYAQGIKLSSPKVAPSISKRNRERLKAIGYVR